MPVRVKITLVLLISLFLSWFLFGILAVAGWIVFTNSVPLRLVMGALAIACSFVIGLCAVFLYRRSSAAYWFITVLMGGILVVSFMDDLGWVDFTLIGITAATLALLIKDRCWYLEKNQKKP